MTKNLATMTNGELINDPNNLYNVFTRLMWRLLQHMHFCSVDPSCGGDYENSDS